MHIDPNMLTNTQMHMAYRYIFIFKHIYNIYIYSIYRFLKTHVQTLFFHYVKQTVYRAYIYANNCEVDVRF